MDQPAFRSKMAQGKNGWPGGKTIVHEIAVAPGSAAAEIETVAICDSPASFICEPYIEERWAKHQASIDPAERTQLVQEIQRYVIQEYLTVPIYINPFVHAVGPNVLPEDDGFHKYWAAPQLGFPWPWEDWEVKK
jgi:ABC-type transport system substrate-binding protein